MQGIQGIPGDKTAIVAHRDSFVGLFCVEAPQVRFEDVVRLKLQGRDHMYPLDRTYVDVCEPGSLLVVGVSTSIPTLIGVEVVDNYVRVRVNGDIPEFVTLKLSGIRAGRNEVRFPNYTEDQMHKNNAFWGQAHQ